MATHLGYEKSDPIEKPDGNRATEKAKKTMKGDFGELEITTPRDRKRPSNPPHRQRPNPDGGLDGKIISMYARA